MIVGTAGHIDHGKTALIRALTGVDTDRLPEERARGITIELGFAPLRLPSGEIISMVDVPGHERFVRTMVAGASGIDAALVVIAADEGVMPQTREHLSVLTALDVRAGVVVLTKSDLTEADWMELVTEDVRSALAESSLAEAPILAASSRTSEGIEAVRDALSTLSRSVRPRARDDLFRFVVDRAFTVKGTGTVVTGTVWSGELHVGSQVTLLPGRATSRVRAIHSHGEPRAAAFPGTRCSLALADVPPTAVPHGTQVIAHAMSSAWPETRLICADIRIDSAADGSGGAGAGAGNRRRDFVLHLAGVEARARISPIANDGDDRDTVASDFERVRVVLDRPLLARRGDRFVLRAPGPSNTAGGGVVIDPFPLRGPRGAWTAVSATAADRLVALLAAAGAAGLDVEQLPARLGVTPSAIPAVVEAAAGVVLGSAVFAATALQQLTADVEKRAKSWLAANSLEAGVSLGSVREQSRAAAVAVDHAIAQLCASGEYAVRDGLLVRQHDESALAAADAAQLARVLHRINEAGAEPPAISELVAEFGPRTDALLRLGERRGNLIAVESVRYYDAPVVLAQVERLRGAMQPGREYSPPELRDVLGVSRKYLIPFLEYCDRCGVTERLSSGRTIRSISSK